MTGLLMARDLERVLWKKRLRGRALFNSEMVLEESLLQPAPVCGKVDEKM